MVHGCNPLYYMKKKNTILVVDDDPQIIQIMSLILTGAGYDIITDNTGDLHSLQSTILPDLILLDNELGNKSGAIICSIIKNHDHTKHIPVMMVSGTEGLHEIARKADADDFLAKPFDMQILLEKVDSLLHRDFMSYQS